MSILPIEIPAGAKLQSVPVMRATNGTYKIGTTDGGDDLVAETTLVAGEIHEPVINKTFSFTEGQNIYISGLTEGVDTYRVIVL